MDLATAKHAFITGGASGIGLGIADALCARGIPVTIADVDADTVQSVLASRPAGVRGQVFDTRDRHGWATARSAAEAVLGPVDILVNNAGIAPHGRELADLSAESFDRIIAINLIGGVNGGFALFPPPRGRGRGTHLFY